MWPMIVYNTFGSTRYNFVASIMTLSTTYLAIALTLNNCGSSPTYSCSWPTETIAFNIIVSQRSEEHAVILTQSSCQQTLLTPATQRAVSVTTVPFPLLVVLIGGEVLSCFPGSNASAFAMSCIYCPTGTYCPAQSTTPIPCPADTYGPVYGLSSCKLCPSGWTSPVSSVLEQQCVQPLSTSDSGHSSSTELIIIVVVSFVGVVVAYVLWTCLYCYCGRCRIDRRAFSPCLADSMPEFVFTSQPQPVVIAIPLSPIYNHHQPQP